MTVRQIAFASTPTVPPPPIAGIRVSENQLFDIWVMNADGRNKTRLTDGHTVNHAPVFSSDGRLFFTASRSGHDNIWSLMPGLPQSTGVSGEAITDNASGAGSEARQASLRDDL